MQRRWLITANPARFRLAFRNSQHIYVYYYQLDKRKSGHPHFWQAHCCSHSVRCRSRGEILSSSPRKAGPGGRRNEISKVHEIRGNGRSGDVPGGERSPCSSFDWIWSRSGVCGLPSRLSLRLLRLRAIRVCPLWVLGAGLLFGRPVSGRRTVVWLLRARLRGIPLLGPQRVVRS